MIQLNQGQIIGAPNQQLMFSALPQAANTQAIPIQTVQGGQPTAVASTPTLQTVRWIFKTKQHYSFNIHTPPPSFF